MASFEADYFYPPSDRIAVLEQALAASQREREQGQSKIAELQARVEAVDALIAAGDELRENAAMLRQDASSLIVSRELFGRFVQALIKCDRAAAKWRIADPPAAPNSAEGAQGEG